MNTPQHKQTKVDTALTTPTAVIIRGLPGIGKTTLANEVSRLLEFSGISTFQINADAVRGSVNKSLGFSHEDRTEHARRLGSMTWLTQSNGYVPIVDFVMPTKNTFDAFLDGIGNKNFLLFTMLNPEGWVCRFPDTQKMYERIESWWGGAVYPEELILNTIKPFPMSEMEEVATSIVDRVKNFVAPETIRPTTFGR